MTILDCNVVNCTYNKDKNCRRQDIHVEGGQAKTSSETCCGSFVNKSCDCGSNCDCDASKETDVLCEACDCKFNDDRKCSAAHIGISGGHADSTSETECGSFQCRC